MKNKMYKIFLVIFLSIALIPIFFINRKANATSQAENRSLAVYPNMFLEDGSYNTNFKQEFNTWLNDHIGFRDSILKYSAEFKYKYLNTISSDNVLLGKNNWLFYSGENKLSLSNYQSKDLYTEDELKNIMKNVEKLKQWSESRGIEFVLMLIPNKEHVYAEYLPDGIKEINTLKKIDQVVDYLSKNSDIKVVYPKQELIEMKKQYPVFYKYDTHWNDIGAYVGYSSLMKEINRKAISLDQLHIDEVEEKMGDLVNLAMISDVIPAYKEYSVNFNDEVQLLYDDEQGNQAYQKYHYSNGNGKIFFMGDSFRSAIKNYVSRDFKYANYVHRNTKIFDEVEKAKPDVFVYELVERYLYTLEGNIF